MPTGMGKVQRFRGLNMTDPATDIADNELAWARNCFGYERGRIQPRKPQTAISAGLLWAGTTVLGDYLHDLGIYTFIAKDARQRAVMWVPGNVNSAFFLSNTGVFDFSVASPFVQWPNAAILVPYPGFPSRPGSLVYNNELYLFPGHTVPGLIFGADDLTTGSSNGAKFRELGTGWQNAGSDFKPKFTFGDVYRGVFVMGGLGAPYESLLAFTNPGATPTTLLDVAKWAGIGYGDGDKLVRFKTVPVLGGSTAIEPYGIAFKRRSAYMVQGDPPSSTDSGTIVISPMMKREGLVAPDALCETPWGLIWCSGQNVWFMPPGNKPVAIGNKISGFLQTLPQQPTSAWFMEYHDGIVYLNFPSPGGIVTGKEANVDAGTGASRTYLPTQQLWCDISRLVTEVESEDDLEKGPMWWGPMDVRASFMKSIDLADGSRQLTGLVAWDEGSSNVRVQPFTMGGGLNYDHGTSTGQVIDGRLDLGDVGVYGQFTGINPDLNGTLWRSVCQDVRFRKMDFGDDSLLKIIDAVEVTSKWDLALGVSSPFLIGLEAPFVAQFQAEDGRVASLFAPSGTPSGALDETDPAATGFALDYNTLTNPVTANPPVVTTDASKLADAFIPVVVHTGGSRFLARIFQFRMLSATLVIGDVIGAVGDVLNLRLFTVKSVTFRARPIGRRPGGSYGG